MAVDEAILEAVGRNEVLPTLRLYAWEPPCLSLGFSQPVADVDLHRLEANGWDLVRRPTGGRAILHTDEITYAVIGPARDPRLAGSVLESYRRLAQALLEVLHRLGLPAEARDEAPAGALPYPAREAPGQKNPVCFEAPSNYEITTQGKKIIGSAQARRKEGVLQHGSLPLRGDLSRITQALVFPDEAGRQRAAARLLARAATVESILGVAPTWNQAVEAFRAAFAHALNLDLRPGALSSQEAARARELEREKFGNREWTEKIH